MKILIAEPEDFSKEAIELLSTVGTVTSLTTSQDMIGRALLEYDIIWIRLGLTIRAADIPEQPRCKFIISGTTGLNHLDLDALKVAHIEVLSLKGQTRFLESITATAEHTIGLMFALVRMIPAAHKSILNGQWDRDLFKGHEVSGRTIGIIGYGRLGKIVASYCKILRMQVMVYDPYVNEVAEGCKLLQSLEELLDSVDYVSLHVPLNEETNCFFNDQFFSMIRQGTYLINTSRGELIDEVALLSALESGKLAGAALDVICSEEFFTRENPLVRYAEKHDNLLLTPHIGGCTWESMSKCEVFMAEMVLQRLAE